MPEEMKKIVNIYANEYESVEVNDLYYGYKLQQKIYNADKKYENHKFTIDNITAI